MNATVGAYGNTPIPVILSGFLAKRFGKRFELAVSSPREAVRALASQLPGFEAALLAHTPGFRIWIDRTPLQELDGLDRHTGTHPIRIVPVIAGAKDSGIGMMIIGAALIYFSGGIAGAFAMSGSVAEASLAAGISSIGTSIMLAGVSSMLMSPPKPASNASNQSNLLFSGAVNTSTQGNAVPVCYGRMRIGSQVISAGIESVQIPYTGLAVAPGFANMGGGGK